MIIQGFYLLQGQVDNIYQKKGIWQDKTEKQIKFYRFEQAEFDFEKVPLKKVKRIILYKNNLYILDGDRNEIYVIDKKGRYIRTIGRPGQGFGDIENAWNFYITPDDLIYVLNSQSKRVDVFNINGKPVRTIRMDRGQAFLDLNESVYVDKTGNLILGGVRNELITIYNSQGKYIKTLLKRENFPGYPKSPSSIGIPCFVDSIDNRLFVMDEYKGIFAKINPSSGIVENLFAPYAENAVKMVENFEKGEKDNAYNLITSRIWAPFCIDENNIIYALLLVPIKNGDAQTIFAFSQFGKLLYSFKIDLFKEEKISLICCDKESFGIYTKERNIFFAYKRH